jgi:hypothetical protein
MTSVVSRRRTILLFLLVVGGLATFATVNTGKWRCWWSLPDYEPRQSIYLQVTPGQEELFVGILRSHAKRHGMWFAVDEYQAGTAGIEYKRYVTQSFNCTANISTNNDHASNLFAVHLTIGPDADEHEFGRIKTDLNFDLIRSFKTVPRPN